MVMSWMCVRSVVVMVMVRRIRGYARLRDWIRRKPEHIKR